MQVMCDVADNQNFPLQSDKHYNWFNLNYTLQSINIRVEWEGRKGVARCISTTQTTKGFSCI